ncbi:hypothetical protein SUGI_1445510 [Cryptomeria japonica]|uniref:Xyloglucan endotransglucosylase/hydrolase n=1 Tax=Cryptomeria japonica TaxID=3369 RepID=A0AAD3RR36_CRYJA|nr:hypothetical protein SUGI_1445510 [Cryptomeria japonica]
MANACSLLSISPQVQGSNPRMNIYLARLICKSSWCLVTPPVLLLHTISRKGGREQQFYLWFDPTADFHTYSLLWNPQQIMFSVDGTPVRVFKNSEDLGVAYPKNQAMRIYSSLWNADNWATRGGAVKIDWSKSPFVASYGNFKAETCSASSDCSVNSWYGAEALESSEQQKLEWVRENYMIYNYCSDSKRFPQGFPAECTR